MEHQVHCPICQKAMVLKHEGATYSKAKKEYEKKVYTCDEHDTWTSIEVPKQK